MACRSLACTCTLFTFVSRAYHHPTTRGEPKYSPNFNSQNSFVYLLCNIFYDVVLLHVPQSRKHIFYTFDSFSTYKLFPNCVFDNKEYTIVFHANTSCFVIIFIFVAEFSGFRFLNTSWKYLIFADLLALVPIVDIKYSFQPV